MTKFSTTLKGGTMSAAASVITPSVGCPASSRALYQPELHITIEARFPGGGVDSGNSPHVKSPKGR